MTALLFVLFTACDADRCQEVEQPFDGTKAWCELAGAQIVMAT